MQEATDLGHGEAVLELDSGLELSSLTSRSSEFRLEAEDHEFGGSPTKLACHGEMTLARRVSMGTS